jgi:hypothetical protein
VGALCLSSSECDHHASRNAGESHCHEDKHKAPTHPCIHPLSLQDARDAGVRIRSSKFIRTKVSVSSDSPIRLAKFIRATVSSHYHFWLLKTIRISTTKMGRDKSRPYRFPHVPYCCPPPTTPAPARSGSCAAALARRCARMAGACARRVVAVVARPTM